MPSTLPLPNDLPSWLSRTFRNIERRLRNLERPDGTQKAMLLQQVEDANKTIAAQQATITQQKGWLDDHQRQLTQQKGWLDDHQRQLTAQANRISTLESQSSSSASTISSLQSRLSAAETKIAANDAAVKALTNRVTALEAAKGRYPSLKARLDAIDNTGL